MSNITELLSKIHPRQEDKNRSTEDLLMDVIAHLCDAYRNKDKRCRAKDLKEIFEQQEESARSISDSILTKIELDREAYVKDCFITLFRLTVLKTFEDHLACAVIKLLEIAKINNIEPVDTDSQNYYKYRWIGRPIPECIYDIIEIFYSNPSPSYLSIISIAIKRIEIISQLLRFDLWQHVELRLKYEELGSLSKRLDS